MNNLWQTIKKSIKWVVIGGVVLAAYTLIPNGEIPSVMVNGEVIEFPYTDENANEDFIIRTDKEFYTPLWAWNGFDVYVMVKNESGKTQNVYTSPFFSKDFTVESIAILDPNATTIIKEPIYGEVCVEFYNATSSSTSTECHQEKIGEKDKEVLGRWNNIPAPTFFSEEDYQQFISDNNISVKDKRDRKAKQKFEALFLKNQTVYFKVRLKANGPFSVEEFDLEIIGNKGGYGILDPTILTDDFNSYNDGDLNGQGGWSGDASFDVQGVVAKEGKAVENLSQSGDDIHIAKQGTGRADGKITVYLKNDRSGSGENWVQIRLGEVGGNSGDGAAPCVEFGLYTGIWIHRTAGWLEIASYTPGDWICIEMEWQSSDYTTRFRIDGGSWTGWYDTYANWTALDNVVLACYVSSGYKDYWDHIAEEPYAPPVRRIMIIE